MQVCRYVDRQRPFPYRTSIESLPNPYCILLCRYVGRQRPFPHDAPPMQLLNPPGAGMEAASTLEQQPTRQLAKTFPRGCRGSQASRLVSRPVHRRSAPATISMFHLASPASAATTTPQSARIVADVANTMPGWQIPHSFLDSAAITDASQAAAAAVPGNMLPGWHLPQAPPTAADEEARGALPRWQVPHSFQRGPLLPLNAVAITHGRKSPASLADLLTRDSPQDLDTDPTESDAISTDPRFGGTSDDPGGFRTDSRSHRRSPADITQGGDTAAGSLSDKRTLRPQHASTFADCVAVIRTAAPRHAAPAGKEAQATLHITDATLDTTNAKRCEDQTGASEPIDRRLAEGTLRSTSSRESRVAAAATTADAGAGGEWLPSSSIRSASSRGRYTSAAAAADSGSERQSSSGIKSASSRGRHASMAAAAAMASDTGSVRQSNSSIRSASSRGRHIAAAAAEAVAEVDAERKLLEGNDSRRKKYTTTVAAAAVAGVDAERELLGGGDTRSGRQRGAISASGFTPAGRHINRSASDDPIAAVPGPSGGVMPGVVMLKHFML